MSKEYNFHISVPTDEEGYILLQCPSCGNYFKIMPSDMEDDGILEIFCPCCGLVSQSYITDDVQKLAEIMVQNISMDICYQQLKKFEHKMKGKHIQIKTGKPPKHEPESPIYSYIDYLEVAFFSCCKKTSKIKPLLKMTGCYCPFCGVKDYEIE